MPSKGFDGDAMHALLGDIAGVVSSNFVGDYCGQRTALKGLLAFPCLRSGTTSECWQQVYTPVVYSLREKTMLVFVEEAQHEFDPGPDVPRFLISLAEGLTEFFGTLVAPAQSSNEQTRLASASGRKYVVFKFALWDSPTKLLYYQLEDADPSLKKHSDSH